VHVVKTILLLLLALLLTVLALGGLISAFKGGGLFDLVIAAFLGWGAVVCWRALKR
jgi:hypothetical protein